MYSVVIRSDPKTSSQIAEVRVWALGFAQQEGKRRVARTWWVLVAGEAPDENRGTWRRSAAAVAQSSPLARRKRGRGRAHAW